MRKDKKEMGMNKNVGAELSDDDLDAVTGGLLYGIHDNGGLVKVVAGQKNLEKYLKSHWSKGDGFTVHAAGCLNGDDWRKISMIPSVKKVKSLNFTL